MIALPDITVTTGTLSASDPCFYNIEEDQYQVQIRNCRPGVWKMFQGTACDGENPSENQTLLFHHQDVTLEDMIAGRYQSLHSDNTLVGVGGVTYRLQVWSIKQQGQNREQVVAAKVDFTGA